MLYGPPGTGKTLLAKVIASECNIPFHYASGSEFIEIYVGQGPKRIRELFEQAKETSPCIVFIDEIDAIGFARNSKFLSGASRESDMTLNQLLTEMDGFDENYGIIVIGATN